MIKKRKINLKYNNCRLFLMVFTILLQILLQPFSLLSHNQKAYADDGNVPEIRIPPGSTGYVVSYLIEGTDKYVPTISSPLRFVDTYGDGVFDVETPDAPGYELVPNQNTKVTVEPERVSSIEIFYRKIVNYQISYVDQDTNQLLTELAENPILGQAGVGSYLNVNQPSVAGYELVANQPTSVLIRDVPMNEIMVYYKKQNIQAVVNYQIHYLVEGTFDKAPGVMPNPVVGSGLVGSELQLILPKIAGYLPVVGQSEKIILSADASKNIIYLYYRPQSTNIPQTSLPTPPNTSLGEIKLSPPNTGLGQESVLSRRWLVISATLAILNLLIFVRKPKKHRLR